MGYEAIFYENAADLDSEGNPRLYFKFTKPSIADTSAVPFEFDGPATEQHIKDYSSAYQKYLATKVVPEVIEVSAEIIKEGPFLIEETPKDI